MKDKVKAALADGTIHADGHTLYGPEAYAPHFTVEDLGSLVKTYHSDQSSPKATIYVKGEPVPSLTAIYNLDFLAWVCTQVGGDTSVSHGFYGRGRRAEALVQEIARAVAA